MRQALKDLTVFEYSEWFGLGPLALAVLAGIRAFVADEPIARWAWTAIAVLMLILCAVYVIWTRKKRS
jgi:Ca2+/Na+ antiporter